jgi:hypothetical protein
MSQSGSVERLRRHLENGKSWSAQLVVAALRASPLYVGACEFLHPFIERIAAKAKMWLLVGRAAHYNNIATDFETSQRIHESVRGVDRCPTSATSSFLTRAA